MELGQLAPVLRRWWWLFIVAPLVAAGATYWVAKHIKPTYEASATLFVNTAPVGNSQGSYVETTYALMLTKSYANLIQSNRVADAVIHRAPVTMTAGDLLTEMNASASADTPIITIKVRDQNKGRAALLANAVAKTFIALNDSDQQTRYSAVENALTAQIRQAQNRINATNATISALSSASGASSTRLAQISSLTGQVSSLQGGLASLNGQLNALRVNQVQSATTVTIGDPAQIPTSPVSPQVELDVLLGLFAGLLLAVGVVVLVEYLDDSLRSPVFAQERLKAPVLGIVSRINGAGGTVLVANKQQDRNAEALKVLRTNIHFTNVDQPPRTLLITSPRVGEGKSTISANYAITVAQTGQRVVLVDGDLRRPSQQRLFGLSPHLGLTDFLGDPSLGLQVVRESGFDNLRVVTSGPIPPNPSELLGSHRMLEFLELLRENADVVIVDSPPVLFVTDASVLANRVDGVIVVLDQQQTTMRAAAQALQSLQMVGGRVLGSVINRFDARSSGYGSYYYYYYAGGYEPTRDKANRGAVAAEKGGL